MVFGIGLVNLSLKAPTADGLAVNIAEILFHLFAQV